MKKIVGITILLLGLGFNCGVAPVFAETIAAAPPNPISAGDTAWMLISSALVFLMTPGLAFFYGGLVRSRNVLNTMMMSLVAMGVIGVTWVLWGYSLAFDVTPGKSGFGEGIEAFIGGLDWIFLNGVTAAAPDNIGYAPTVPHQVFMVYQMMFAINASNSRFWEAPITRYVDECLAGKSGPRGKDFNMRWIASMVAEAHRILMRGGVFMYPRDTKDPSRAGRLRLLYEANPIGMVMEQAGGRASTGEKPVLDVSPTSLHQRIGLVFGSRNEVERIERYHSEPVEIENNNPLFAERSLFRV